jgi:hypothetical protein
MNTNNNHTFGFDVAVVLMKNGLNIGRRSWNDDTYLYKSPANGKYYRYSPKSFAKWYPGNEDLEAEDYYLQTNEIKM